MGFSRWADWTSERTGFGKLFRKRAFYPGGLPLFISSDHYVDPHTGLREDEINPSYNIYFSWNREKVTRLQSLGRGHYYHCRHPWLDSPHRTVALGKAGSGTLLFWPHSRPGIEFHVDLEKTMDLLASLPRWYRPFTINLSCHDIAKGLHTKLRKLKIPITTAGSLLSQNFPSRFYEILSEYQFTAGIDPGSHVFYSLDAGRPHRLLHIGETEYFSHEGTKEGATFNWVTVNYGDSQDQSGILSRYLDLKLDHDKVTLQQRDWARTQMGVDSHMSRSEFSRIIWGQLGSKSSLGEIERRKENGN